VRHVERFGLRRAWPTHHSIEDLAWTRVVPNLTIVVPADPAETSQAVHAIAGTEGPVFLRLSRMPVPEVHPADYDFRIGRAVSSGWQATSR